MQSLVKSPQLAPRIEQIAWGEGTRQFGNKESKDQIGGFWNSFSLFAAGQAIIIIIIIMFGSIFELEF